MITVLYVETGSGYGGSAQSLLQLLGAIDRRRVRPIVAAYQEGSAIRRIRELGVPILLLPGPVSRGESYAHLLTGWLLHELPRALRLLRLIHQERVTLVHLNTCLYANLAGLWAAKLSRRPVVCHLRLSRKPTQSERLFGRWVDQFIALTQHAKAQYQAAWPGRPIAVIYNAAERPTSDAASADGLRRELGFAESTPLIGLLARCVPGKGYEEFLRAAALVRSHYPATQFLIVGNGAGGDRDYEARMQGLAGSLGLNGTVKWLGWREDSARILRSLDLAVQASSTFPEGLSRVILEAMAQGTPVIATALPSSTEALDSGQAGWLVPPGDAQALAQGIVTLLDDPALARRYGEAGRRRAAALFSVPAHAATIQQLYEEVLGAEGRGREHSTQPDDH